MNPEFTVTDSRAPNVLPASERRGITRRAADNHEREDRIRDIERIDGAIKDLYVRVSMAERRQNRWLGALATWGALLTILGLAVAIYRTFFGGP